VLNLAWIFDHPASW